MRLTRRRLIPLVALLSSVHALAQAATTPSSGVGAIAGRHAAAAKADSDHEPPPALVASAVLPAELRSGEHFKVAEAVTNDGYMNHFAIESDYGRFEVTGLPLLRIRVREVAAIARLKEVSKSGVFLEAAAKSAVRPVTAAAAVIDDPVGTAQGVPGGVKRAFGRLKHKAGAAKDAVAGDGDDADDDGDTQAVESSTGDKAVAVAKSYLGITAAHRRWAQKLGIDPYSTNPTLNKELDGVAKVDRAGGLAASVAMPSLGSAVGSVTKVSELVWSKDPLELLEMNKKDLAAMAVAPELAERFLGNRFYSPSKQTAITAALVTLAGTADRQRFLVPAALARSEEEALFYVESAQLLAGFHARIEPIAALLPGRVLAKAQTRGGGLVTLVAVDHLCWTAELDVLTGEAGQGQSAPRTLWVGGSLSQRAAKEIGARGFTVRPGARARLGAGF